MTKRNLFMGGGAAALGLALIALPSAPAHSQEPSDTKVAQMEQNGRASGYSRIASIREVRSPASSRAAATYRSSTRNGRRRRDGVTRR